MSSIFGPAPEQLSQKQGTQNADVGGLSFLQLLSTDNNGIVPHIKDEVKETAYVHPMQKRSSVKINLALCTESLGSENGTKCEEEISLLAREVTNLSMIPPPMIPNEETKISFPPPLKSYNGNHCRTVKSYTEDGRLVVQQIRVSSQPCFVSERSEGRLRLCLAEDYSPEQDEDEEVNENETELEAPDEEEGGDEEEADEEEEDEDEDEEKGILVNKKNVKGKKIRKTKWRCNIKGYKPKTLLNWKKQQFWVTT